MHFQNLTPFAAQHYSGYDASDRRYDIVVLKTGYWLVPVADTPGLFTPELIEDDSIPLCAGDEHEGDPSTTSIVTESDFVPYKPRCDVLLVGFAHCPYAQGARQWDTRLRFGCLDRFLPNPPVPPAAEQAHDALAWTSYRQRMRDCQDARHACVSNPPWAQLAIDKTLRVTGPRQFKVGLLASNAGEAQRTVRVPLRWELAYGGSCRVDDPDRPDKPLINAVCFQNPLGCGWQVRGTRQAQAQAHEPIPEYLPAPQLMYPDERIEQLDIDSPPPANLDAKAMAKMTYAHRPANYGPLGKAWAPRLALAGTYDATWEAERHPYLPKDFNMAYWNGAPADQQIDYPVFYNQPLAVELCGLVRHSHALGGRLLCPLPAHRAIVFAYADETDEGGTLIPIPMVPDTLVIDTDTLLLTITWRAALLQSTSVTRLEARFEIDPSAPLVKCTGAEEFDA